MREFSAGYLAKGAGFRSVTEVADMCGVSRVTMHTWYVKEIGFFKLLLLGCQAPLPFGEEPLPLVSVACISGIPLHRLTRYQQEKPDLYRIILSACVEIQRYTPVSFL